ncbi:DNA cytosine methyltransferase [Ciceribacter ferrooxidans]|uniref:DNA (cytosine-5-)-methyltransferase n=1 Tax=Ciceribacter ferrooxidans TaxID=2509717 RepID=A0A4Q2SVN8_9HYPH|nr:DNA cytosine methyltransferase [Ciceribacter ferrooxidans]RYC10156.1 DNA cytosine methyltransferase [Ciceribacter ferrooxidans]
MTLVYGSVCSGIEAATMAWHVLGWKPAFFSEIEAFPSAVLAHHYGSNMPGEPLSKNGVPNHGDFTQITADAGPVDVLVGGTPCQSFSVAGKRLGLDDPRGNLALEYLALARRLHARWFVWENVPGVVSSVTDEEDGEGGVRSGLEGREAGDEWVEESDFATFLSFVRECGYGFAYRVLDAQYVRVDGFGRAVPQRRRRVFVVGYLGDWRRAAAVLLEPQGMRGDPAPRREAGQGIAPTIASRPTGGGGLGTDFDLDGGLISRAFGGGNTSGPLDVSTALTALTAHGHRIDFEVETFVAEVAPTLNAGGNDTGGERQPGTTADTATMLVAHTLLTKENDSHAADLDTYVAHTLKAEGFDASEDGTGRGTPIVPAVAAPLTLAIRGRAGDPDIEWRQDGTANAILTPNGGRAGVGVGAIAFAHQAGGKQTTLGYSDDGSVQTLSAHQTPAIAHPWAVRRLTPRECERLQGFPDDFTDVPWNGKKHAADGPRYKALGNSMAVNVMRWIGRRIDLMEKLAAEGKI